MPRSAAVTSRNAARGCRSGRAWACRRRGTADLERQVVNAVAQVGGNHNDFEIGAYGALIVKGAYKQTTSSLTFDVNGRGSGQYGVLTIDCLYPPRTDPSFPRQRDPLLLVDRQSSSVTWISADWSSAGRKPNAFGSNTDEIQQAGAPAIAQSLARWPDAPGLRFVRPACPRTARHS